MMDCASGDIHCVHTSPKLYIEQVSLQAVKRDALARERFNTNNHWPSGQKPDDYDQALARQHTGGWIDTFYPHYGVLNLPARHLSWMHRAWLIGRTTCRFPAQYQDELDMLVAQLGTDAQHLFQDAHGRFIRSQTVSLKSGVHGVGPYRSVREVIESIVTTREGHSPLDHYAQQPLKLFVLPWVDMQPDNEFRVFVHENRVTAMSQQHLYLSNITLHELPDDASRIKLLTTWCDTIVAYHRDVLVDALAPLTSYVMDIVLIKNAAGDFTARFIEPNTFGQEYASGSSLFGWIADHDKLYRRANATSQPVCVRFTI